MISLDPLYMDGIVRMALLEDMGSGDITTTLTIPDDANAQAVITVKESGLIAGLEFLPAVFERGSLSPRKTSVEILAEDGDRVNPGDCLAKISGHARTILSGERTALNIIQKMSGIATITAEYVDLVSHTKAKIVDTRKTTSGLRRLEKYAVTVGGGYNHRFGLSDGVLIKDNHIAGAGGITAAVKAAKLNAPHTLKIEVEVGNLDMLREAIDAGADIVMLDNMALQTMREAVEIAAGRVLLEASGGVNKESVKAIAETGVDIISVGALTHSAPALDISLNFI